MQGVNKKSFIIITLGIIVFLASAESTFALYYYGGGYDGYDVKLGANTDMVSISSVADQTFTTGDSATAISAITVTLDVGQAGGGINTTNHIRVVIPASLDMVWDTTDTTATFGGSASTKVSNPVSYPNSKTLLINVTANFVSGDTLTVTDLSFKNFNSVGFNNLTLSIDGGATTAATDDKKKTIGLPASTVTFTGGSYDGYDVKLGSNTDMASISSAANQIFTFGDSATAISAITVTLDVGQAGGGINTTNHIRVVIPASLDMAWDTTDTTATFGGSASAKVSNPASYPNSKTLLINVTANFISGDTLTVADLSFKNFNSVGFSSLTLSIDGGATTAATDDKKKTIGLPASTVTFTGGSYDGYAFGWNSDDAEAELALFLARFFLSFE